MRFAGAAGPKPDRWRAEQRGWLAVLRTPKPGRNRLANHQRRSTEVATDRKRAAAGGADATIGRIRDLNDRILETARKGGESSLEAYERLLTNIADMQAAAGDRGAEWVSAFGHAQAAFTRELAKNSPAAARRIGERITDATRGGARRVRRVPGVADVEGEARGVVAREQDLPIARYESLKAAEIVKRLPKLSEVDLGKVDAYERKHDNRKTVLKKIESLRS